MRIEVYYSPFCEACSGLRGPAPDGAVIWKDVTRHIEEAVRLGIFKPPALVVDGRLVDQGTRALARLRKLVTQAEI
ncbi:hypothetical protein BH24PSE2_BH24PSE2_06770 [soil metagenome]